MFCHWEPWTNINTTHDIIKMQFYIYHQLFQLHSGLKEKKVFLYPRMELLTASLAFLALPDYLHLSVLAVIFFFSQVEGRVEMRGKEASEL